MKTKQILALLLVALCFTACSDELESNHKRPDGYLYFNVSHNNNWAENGTRSSIAAPIELECDMEGQPIYLHTSIEAGFDKAVTPETRGNRLTGAVFTNDKITDFGVYGYGSAFFLDGVKIQKIQTSQGSQEGTVGTSSEDVFWYEKEVDFDNAGWANGTTATFYGYAPYFTANTSLNSNGLRVYKDDTTPTIEYKVPSDVSQQLDILTAKHANVSKNQDVELVFDHVLSAIKFEVKNGKNRSSSASDKDKGSMIWNNGIKDYYVTIQTISIKNVYDNGTWVVGTDVYTNPAPTWSYSTSTTPDNVFTISPNKSLNGATIGDEVNPDNSGNVFLMMPQTTPSVAKLEIVCEMTETNNSSAKQTVSLYASLANITWKPGYTYIYSLSLSDFDYVFTIHEDSSNDYSGTETDKDNGTFSNNSTTSTTVNGKDAYKVEIRSYRMDVNSNSEPVKWKAYHSLDGGTTYTAGIPNAWMHLKDNNGTSTELVNADLHNGAIATSNDRQFDLVVDEYLVKKNMDLSLYNIDNETRIKRSTANCYIVKEPGIYRIPLIYGNAFYNGAENTGAYISQRSAVVDVIMKTMVNYLNQEISSPYISTDLSNMNGKTIGGATLVWEDVKNLISDVRVVTDNVYYGASNNDNHYLQFKVAPATMNYGNAIVAVQDADNNIIWSWHIWVCNPEDFTSNNTYSTTRDQVTYYISGANLGWVDAKSTAIQLEAPRSIMVKLVQEESGKELVFTVNQDGVSFTPSHRNAMYQFGRKDPMAGATPNSGAGSSSGVNGTNITTYGPKTFAVSEIGAAKLTIGDAIQNPNLQYIRATATTPTRQKHLYHAGGASLTTGHDVKNLWNINSPLGSSNSDQQCYGKSVYDPSPIGYRVPPSAAFANFGLGSWSQIDRTAIDGYYYASFGNGQLKLPFVGYRDKDNSGKPVDFNYTTYYGLASASAGDYNEYQMVRMARHELLLGNSSGFDDSHKGMRNRSTQIRPIKDPDSGIPERDADIEIHGNENVNPNESLSRENSSKWTD